MWIALALLFVLITFAWLITHLSQKKGKAEARLKAKKDETMARRKRDAIEANVFGLDDDDLERLRKKWTRA